MTVGPPQLQTATEYSPRMGNIAGNLGQPEQPPKLARRPFAAPQALKIRDVDVVVLEDRCKGCSFCIEFCPRDALEQDTKLNIRGVHAPRVRDPSLCVGCGVCEEICPDFAIFLVDKGERH